MKVVFAPSGIPASARYRAIGTFPIEQTKVATAMSRPTNEQQHVTDEWNAADGMKGAERASRAE